MIDVTNQHVEYRQADVPIEFSSRLNEPRKSGDSTQRNFYQKMKKRGRNKTREDSRFGPAVVVRISASARNRTVPMGDKHVLRYDRWCRLEYMDM